MPTFKVEIPKNVQELLDLANDVYIKHQAEGTASPLNSLQDHNWSVEGPRLVKALEIHKQAEDLKRKMLLAYDERDKLTKNVEEIVKSSRDVLKGVYGKTPKKLGEWGFNVSDAAVNTAPAQTNK